LLQQAEIAFGRLNDMAGLSIHPQLRRVTIDTPSGEAEVVAFAVSGSDTGTLKKVPTIGEHSELIRKEFS
jgi:crotonobetainyl-CoA:carnitine CoA-transferase CaiB-like acyl-CoA transferase